MKNKIIYLLTTIIAASALLSCEVDKPNTDSIYIDREEVQNDFDRWLDINYVLPYNIRVMYKMLDTEVNNNYYTVPVKMEQSIMFAKILKHTILEAYDEITQDPTFVRRYFPKMLYLVGNLQVVSNGTTASASASNGIRINYFNMNHRNFNISQGLGDITSITSTSHHEFCHILNQKSPYTGDFKEISRSNYVGDTWSDRTTGQARELGFVSNYAGSSHVEDFAETYQEYVNNTQNDWDLMLLQIESSEARTIINQKLGIVRSYFAANWGIDIDVVRQVYFRRLAELNSVDISPVITFD